MTIAAELRELIIGGGRAPGDPLPSEEELADELGYSRPTIREALRILENEGLIEMKRGLHGGPRVRQFTVSEVAKPIGVYLQLGDVPVSDVWTARERIVTNAVGRLACTPRVDIAPLATKVQVLESHVDELSKFYVDMIETSEVAVELAGNATELLVVGALRHVIEAELAFATAATCNVDNALANQRLIADAWRRTLTHIRRGQPRAAMAAYEDQGQPLRNYFRHKAMAVGEVRPPTSGRNDPRAGVMARLKAAARR